MTSLPSTYTILFNGFNFNDHLTRNHLVTFVILFPYGLRSHSMVQQIKLSCELMRWRWLHSFWLKRWESYRRWCHGSLEYPPIFRIRWNPLHYRCTLEAILQIWLQECQNHCDGYHLWCLPLERNSVIRDRELQMLPRIDQMLNLIAYLWESHQEYLMRFP